jgi:DNA-directed RNA polymerase subunit M/transcription elongation factor TFIIS
MTLQRSSPEAAMDQVRISAYSSLAAILGTHAATYLEAYAYSSSCKTGHLCGIPVWQYSTGTTLFETDKHEAHTKEKLAAYMDQVKKIQCILSETSMLETIKAKPETIETIEDHAIKKITEFGHWHEQYLEDITQSKKILEEREEETSAFIKCMKCHSNRVDTEQKQTRSADEPMTVFCLCRNCGKRFTIH